MSKQLADYPKLIVDLEAYSRVYDRVFDHELRDEIANNYLNNYPDLNYHLEEYRINLELLDISVRIILNYFIKNFLKHLELGNFEIK
jgi:hypothetical protein